MWGCQQCQAYPFDQHRASADEDKAAVPSRKSANVAITIFFIAIPPELRSLGGITTRRGGSVPVNLIYDYGDEKSFTCGINWPDITRRMDATVACGSAARMTSPMTAMPHAPLLRHNAAFSGVMPPSAMIGPGA